jgi:hypothetical protein
MEEHPTLRIHTKYTEYVLRSTYVGITTKVFQYALRTYDQYYCIRGTDSATEVEACVHT